MFVAVPASSSPYSARIQRELGVLVRFVRVIASTEFKLKYADSALGYLWSLIKPLAYFAVLLVVFGSFFKLRAVFPDYPIYLLIGIVLFTFFADAASGTMLSFVVRGSLLGKLSFPRIVIPISTTMVATLTFMVNLIAILVYIAAARIVPRLDWLWLLPLLGEIYIFTFGIALLLATLFVRFRDVGQVWELLSQLLFYATPIIYPVSYLPDWARPIALLNPLAQAMQDIRRVILYRAPDGFILTAPDVLGQFGRIYPISIALFVLFVAFLVYRHEEPWLAERV